MSEPNRSVNALGTHRRPFASSALLVVGAIAVAAILSTGAAARSQVVPVNNAPPTITGAPVVGETLVASEGSWTPAPDQVAYAWQRCDTAGGNCMTVGTNSSSYVIPGGDLGRTIRVEVTASNAGDDSMPALSAPTAIVTALTAPVNTAEPVISGSTVAGSTLSATTGTWSGVGTITFAYRWVRCGADGGLPDGSNCPSIDGATNSSYELGAVDIGMRLRVRVTASNAAGLNTATSNATDTVTQSLTVGPPVNTAEPTITGTFVQGRLLSASVGTWNGATPLSFAYDWRRCPADGGLPDGSNCAAISGATSSSYTLSADDVGHPIRIRVTASNSLGPQTATSNASPAVQSSTTSTAQAPRNTFAPSISGTPTQGQSLFASVGVWSGTTPLTYTYRWLRCDADGGEPTGSDCSVIAAATGATHALVLGDVGRRLRVQVTARNTSGTATATSGPTSIVQVVGSTPPPPPSPEGQLPPGAVRLPNGKYSIPSTSVSLPVRLVIDRVVLRPNPVRSRRTPLVLRVHVVDTRGYFVRDALVFARPTRPVTTTPRERRTSRDGWATLRTTPRASFPLRNGNVRFLVRARKQGGAVRAGVSTRRVVQVATRG